MDKVLGLLQVESDELSDSFPLLSRSSQIEMNKLMKIGRNSQECIYTIDDPAVSNVHCMIWGIRFDSESIPMCYIKDLSLNGTLVNGELLERDIPYLLDDQDVIELSNGFKFRFSAVKEEKMSQLILGMKICSNWDAWEVVPRIVGSGTFGNVLVAKKTQFMQGEEEKYHHGNELNKENMHGRSMNKDSGTRISKKRPSYAVKIITTSRTRVVKEASILQKLDHPNIIKIYQSHVDSSGHLYIFQDLMSGGDLFSYLAKGDCLVPISETEALIIVYQILLALKFLHHNGIVHRDLKLDNILLYTPEPCAKVVLADFGIAREFSRSPKERMHTVVGTPEYCAPEVGFRADRNIYRSFSRTATIDSYPYGYDSKCDIWSLGVITHIMLTGISPFYGDGSESGIIKNVKLGNLNFAAKQWIPITDSAKNFVKKCLQVSTSNRCDVKEALNLSWIAKHRSQLERIYNKKVLQGSSEQIKMDQNLDEIVSWKHKLPKSVKLSPEKNPKKKLKLLDHGN